MTMDTSKGEEWVTGITQIWWVWAVVITMGLGLARDNVRRYGMRASIRPAERSRHCAPGRASRFSAVRRERMWQPAHRGPLYSVATVLANAKHPRAAVGSSIITDGKGWTYDESAYGDLDRVHPLSA